MMTRISRVPGEGWRVQTTHFYNTRDGQELFAEVTVLLDGTSRAYRPGLANLLKHTQQRLEVRVRNAVWKRQQELREKYGEAPKPKLGRRTSPNRLVAHA